MTRKGKPYTSPSRASITRSTTMASWLEVATPYRWQFVDELKAEIQPPHRKWNPDTKIWLVHESWTEELVKICTRYFDEVISDLEDDGSSDDNLFDQVFTVVDGQYRDKVYYALAQALHPDHGGSQEIMKKLNEAYEMAKGNKKEEI